MRSLATPGTGRIPCDSFSSAIFAVPLPPTVGFLVQLIKLTSVTAIIGFIELTRTGQIINNVTFKPFLVFSVVAGIYFILCWPLSYLSARLERRYAAATR